MSLGREEPFLFCWRKFVFKLVVHKYSSSANKETRRTKRLKRQLRRTDHSTRKVNPPVELCWVHFQPSHRDVHRSHDQVAARADPIQPSITHKRG